MIFNHVFPNPSRKRPVDFDDFVQRCILPEVRRETQAFYGSINCLESQYPGLDYSSQAARNRLSRFVYHARLFNAFDTLRLTESEISCICTWEGTKHKKEAYERIKGVKIRDTTWDGVEPHVPRQPESTVTAQLGVNGAMDHGEMAEGGVGLNDENEKMEPEAEEDEDEEEEVEDESDVELVSHSVGVELNRRLLAATEARARGEEAVLDADWEQWLKEAAERRNLEGLQFPSILDQTPGAQWSSEIPEVFRYSTDETPPHVAALQARMPPPPILPSSLLIASSEPGSAAPRAGTSS